MWAAHPGGSHGRNGRGARSTGSLSVGNVSGFISASSTGAAEAYGLLAEFSLTTGTINGTVSAATAGSTAAALMGGAGITTTIGSTGVIEATATGNEATGYALYSGSNTGSGFSTENTADNVTVHAGASHQRHLGTGRLRSGRLRGYHYAAVRNGSRSGTV